MNMPLLTEKSKYNNLLVIWHNLFSFLKNQQSLRETILTLG